MRKSFGAALLLVMTMALCACSRVSDSVAPPDDDVTVAVAANTTATSSNTEPPSGTSVFNTETTAAMMPPTESTHSPLYLPEYTAQQMTEYFKEVVLNTEYTDGMGDPTLVQKWMVPITYHIYGAPTDEDKAVLEAVFAQLNDTNGFPGISAVSEAGTENMSVYFLDPDMFRQEFAVVIGEEDATGATQYWYDTVRNEIDTAHIGYRTDIDQSVRNSVLIEEVINAMGMSDSELREDSIVYQYSDENTVLSDVDLVILNLMYDPHMQCGMDADACAAVIEDLYY